MVLIISLPTTKTMKKKAIAVIVLILLIIISSIYFFQKNPAKSTHITLYGNIDIRQTSLAFNGNGRITELTAQEGDLVKKGDNLGQLDTESLILNINKAKADIEGQKQAFLRLRNGSRPEDIAKGKAAVAAAQAEVERTSRQLNRLSTLQTTGAISQQELDAEKAIYKQAQAQLNSQKKNLQLLQIGPRGEDIAQAKASVESAEAALALLEYQLKESRLVAPIDGVVRARLLEVGDMASTQKPVYTLAIVTPKWVKAYIPEPDLGKIRHGMAAEVFIDSAPDKAIKGKIGYISSVAEFTPKTVQTEELRTNLVYEIRVHVDDGQDQLRLGMPATVRISLDKPSETEKH